MSNSALLTTIRVRIAPSPSGHLHVGTARTAVYNWLFARHHGGSFILRIEDTDRSRSSDEMVESIQESLRWLGLEWDEGPFFQSQRTELYRAAAQRLLDNGNAYYCYCTPERLDQMRQQQTARGENPRYDRHCRNLTADERARLDAEGTPKIIRIRLPEEGVSTFDDLVLGTLTKGNDELDDFVIVRRDHSPTYNFVCAVDDADMQISHVIRGNDHITNTFKQLHVYSGLGVTPPKFAHLPLILGKDKKKISKRRGAVAVTEYREQGYLPEAFVNFLALLGWSPGDDREYLPSQDLINAFSLERVTSTNPVFDTDKLTWLNGEYLRAMDPNELLRRLLPLIMESGLATRLEVEARWHWMLEVVKSVQERLHFLTDFLDMAAFYFRGDLEYDQKGVRKHFLKQGAIDNLTVVRDAYAAMPEAQFTKERTEQVLRNLAEERGQKVAVFIHPLRLALTGRTKGPGMFDITSILGKDCCLRRIDRAREFIAALSPSEDST